MKYSKTRDNRMESGLNIIEFDILSMQFICRYSLEADLLQEHGLLITKQNNVYSTPNVHMDETTNLENVIYTMYSNYQKVIERVSNKQGIVYLYITHRTQKARELVIPRNLLVFLAEKEIYLGVD